MSVRKRVAWSAVYVVLTSAIVFCLINYLGRIISLFGFKEYGEIFSQIEGHMIFVPFYVPLLFILLINVLSDAMIEHRGWFVVLTIFFILLAFIITILLTIVNGIVFIRVLESLIKVITSGEVSV